MIINERNNIEKYSIICMFRKHFENILLFFEIIFVLLQAYLLILLKFRMWFKYGLKAQKLLAQGIALGIIAVSKAPCKGKSFVNCPVFKAFALTGRQVCVHNTPGRCPGLGASALSGRVEPTCET